MYLFSSQTRGSQWGLTGWAIVLALGLTAASEAQQYQQQLLNKGSLYTTVSLLQDFDGDGDLDIITTRLFDRDLPPGIEWLTNDGTGQFPRQSIIEDDTLSLPTSLHLCDCDNDGDTDYVLSDQNPGQLVWYQRQPDSAFIKWTIDSSLSFNHAAVADFNNDGNVDVVGVGITQPDANLYFNDGALNFTKTPLTQTPSGASFVAADDIDADGDVDIVLGGIVDLRLFRNTGNGTFDQGQMLPIGFSVSSIGGVEIADVDGDGVKDILTYNVLSSGLFVLNGAANFVATAIDTSDSEFGGDLLVRDVDDNGLVDVIRQNTDALQLAMLYQDTPMVFRKVILDRNWGSSLPAQMAIGDLDADGDPDLVVPDIAGDGKVAWYENIDGLLFRHALYGDIRGVSQPKMVDLDGDGDRDILLAAGSGDIFDDVENEVIWYENRGGLGFVAWRIDDDIDFPADVEVGDLNADGQLDVVATARDSGDLVWYQRTGMVWERQTIEENANAPLGCAVADIDGNGSLDVALASSADAKVYWYMNDSTGVFTRRIVDPNLPNPHEVAIADLNGDGFMDMAVAAANPNNSAAVYINDGAQQFGRQIVFADHAASDIAIADWDGDDQLDIVISLEDNASTRSPDVVLIHNDGNATFTATPLISDLATTTAIVLSDVDGDADPDLVFGTNRSGLLPTLGIGLQQGNRAEPILDVINSAGEISGIDANDVNGDGVADLVATLPLTTSGGDVALLIGNRTETYRGSATTNIDITDPATGSIIDNQSFSYEVVVTLGPPIAVDGSAERNPVHLSVQPDSAAIEEGQFRLESAATVTDATGERVLQYWSLNFMDGQLLGTLTDTHEADDTVANTLQTVDVEALSQEQRLVVSLTVAPDVTTLQGGLMDDVFNLRIEGNTTDGLHPFVTLITAIRQK